MKKEFFIIGISIFCLSFLTSCTSINGGCGTRYGCCQTAVKKFPCKKLVDRCEPACSTCRFNDPACTACWNCINYDGCFTSGNCSGCSNQQIYLR